MVSDWTDHDMFVAAVEQAGVKTPPARLGDVRLQPLSEGLCVQTIHIGSFDDEAAVLERMHHDFIPNHGLRLDGKHHEIYFSDLRKVTPEKLRTILRQTRISGLWIGSGERWWCGHGRGHERLTNLK